MVPKEPCTSTAMGALDFEDCTKRSMDYVHSFALDAGDADRREVRLAEATLLHDKMLVLDLDIVPIVFRIQADRWIVGVLLVVVDHPIVVEFGGKGIVEN